MFTRACRLSVSWSRPIHSTIPFHFLKINFNIIFHPRLNLQSAPFPPGFPTKDLYAPLLCPTRAACTACFILLDLFTQLLMKQFTTFSNYLVPFRPISFPQHPILKQCQPVFLLQCDRLKLHSHSYRIARIITVLYFLIFIFTEDNEEKKRFWTEW
jgi:hypothetical protein